MPTPTLMPGRGPGGLSPASNDLGLGSMLSDQVAGMTDEERKKRLLAQRQRDMMGPAAFTLFGGLGGTDF